MAYQRLAHSDGEIATARAAAAANAVMCLSTLATTGIRTLAKVVPEAQRWFQLYVYEDRGISRELAARAAEHGYEAMIVTVDLPVRGVRGREFRVEAESVAGDQDPYELPGGREDLMTPGDVSALVDPKLDWSDIEQIVADTPLPVLVKGILRPRDAELAAAHGARGVIVSNHGGRQLDTVLAGADALGPIVDAVGDRLEVLVDGGIRRGTDVLKALALGARAVLVGRPLLWGLAVDGAAGVQRVLEILLAEFDTALALAGAPRATDLDRTFVGGALAMKVLVTGVSGYVGARLVPALERAGTRWSACRATPSGVSRGAGRARDAVTGEGSTEALDGVDVAYFLIHSMEPSARRPASRCGSARAAENFARAARRRAASSESSTWVASSRPAARRRSTSPAGSRSRTSCSTRARLGRVPRLDRDRRTLALVPLPGPPGRAAAGADRAGVATM